MDKMNKKIPALRFPGFEGEWEKNVLADISAWASGGTPSKDELTYWNGDLPWISASSMRGSEFSDSEFKITKEGLISGSRLALKGSILILVRGSMLFKTIPVGIATRDVAFNQDVKSITITTKSTSKFILFWFKASENKLLNMVVGTGIGAGKLELSDLKKMQLFLPTLPEQQKIADFLTAVDDKINRLTRKKTLLEQYKKGVMQKIFSQEIRFKDDDGKDFPEWEVKRGKLLFKSHSNKNHIGDLPILAATQDKGMVYRDTIGIEIQSSEASVKSYKIVEKGDFVISLRSFQGGIEYSNFHGICSPAYTVLKPTTQICDQFFRYYFKKEDFITRLSKTVVGIRDGKQISYDAFSGLKIPVPCLAEQQKIANFLTGIDKKIELVNTQLEKTKEWKKGLLQQMFV